MIAVSLLLSACSDGATGYYPITPVILSLTADRATIEQGTSVTLTWDVNDSTASVTLSPATEGATARSAIVAPLVTTTYVLTATNEVGTAEASVTVTVVPTSGGTADGTTSNTGLSPSDAGTPTTDSAQAGTWVDAAGNLAGLVSECGNLPFVSAKPDGGELIAGVSQQGLWSSAGELDTWTKLGEGAGSVEITNRLTSIVYDPVGPNTYWESGIYNGGGVYRTDDNGTTFRQLGDAVHVDLVSVDFSDPDRQTLLAGKHEQPTLLHSADGGETWNEISESLPPGIGFASFPLVLDRQTFLLGTHRGTASGIFRSTDGGVTWSEAFSGGVVGRPLQTADGSMYWLRQDAAGAVRSVDDGATWQETGDGPMGNSFSIIEVTGGRIAALAGNSVVISADDGQTWQTYGPALPYEATGLAYAAARDTFYAWRYDCNAVGDNPILPNSIIRLDVPS